MLQGEHFAILSTFIKLPFSIKTFVLSIFERRLKTDLLYFVDRISYNTDSNKSSDILLNPVCIMLIYIITVLLCKYLCIVQMK